MASGITPQPGDYIVFARADHRYDVLRVDVEGVRQFVQPVGVMHEATYVVARAGAEAEGGRALFAFHATQQVTAPVRPAPRMKAPSSASVAASVAFRSPASLPGGGGVRSSIRRLPSKSSGSFSGSRFDTSFGSTRLN
jgi:hypothetical protein